MSSGLLTPATAASPSTGQKSLFSELRRLRGSRLAADQTALNDIMERLGQLLRKQRQIPDQRSFTAEVRRLILKTSLNDEKTLEHLRDLYLKASSAPSHSGKKDGEQKGVAAASGRSASRVRDIQAALDAVATECKENGGRLPAYLDVGCSEGKITAAVAGYLRLDPKAAFGVDVVEQPPDASFTFTKTDGVALDFPDDTFDLETMFMSAHHFREPSKVFGEARRVARKGATLIMREHDTRQPYLALFFDLLHSFYAVVFNAEETPEEFAKTYATGQYAFYRSREEWAKIAEAAGWKLERYIQPNLGPKKQTDFVEGYYAVFRAV